MVIFRLTLSVTEVVALADGDRVVVFVHLGGAHSSSGSVVGAAVVQDPVIPIKT
jgi:hypothetical protein